MIVRNQKGCLAWHSSPEICVCLECMSCILNRVVHARVGVVQCGPEDATFCRNPFLSGSILETRVLLHPRSRTWRASERRLDDSSRLWEIMHESRLECEPTSTTLAHIRARIGALFLADWMALLYPKVVSRSRTLPGICHAGGGMTCPIPVCGYCLFGMHHAG